MSTGEAPKPIVKWAGGKQGSASELCGLFAQDFDTYFEPFLGGGSVFFHLRPARAVVADENGWLVDAYLAVRDDWKRVGRILDEMSNTKSEYLRIRSIPPDELDRFRRAAHLVYLNKTCFRGLFRVNRRGQFNVPYGAYERRYYDPDNFRRVSESLRGVSIRAGDFERGLAGIGRRDFAYLDPPYYKLGGHSDFNRYTPSQFQEGDHERLAGLCRELDRGAVRWALTNSDTPLVRRLFRGFRMKRVKARREIKLASKERDITELFISNY